MLQLDGSEGNKCTCFMFLKPTAMSLALVDAWEQNIISERATRNQVSGACNTLEVRTKTKGRAEALYLFPYVFPIPDKADPIVITQERVTSPGSRMIGVASVGPRAQLTMPYILPRGVLPVSFLVSTSPRDFQPPFKDPLIVLQDAGLRVEILSDRAMPAGKVFFHGEELRNYTMPADAVIVHNNWITGHDEKKSRFERHDLWFVGDTSFPTCGLPPGDGNTPGVAPVSVVVWLACVSGLWLVWACACRHRYR